MVGGFHTTGNFLTWVLYYLAIYPDMQEKVYVEHVQSIKNITEKIVHFQVFEEIQEVLGPNSELDIKSMDKLK